MRTDSAHVGGRQRGRRCDARSRALLAMAGAIALAAQGCKSAAPTAVIDSGDEVVVVRSTTRAHELVVAKQGANATLRLVGIYTFAVWPREKTDVSGIADAATQYVEQQVGGKVARLVLERKALDPRGRYLGFIELDGEDLGQRLVEQGHAAVYTEFPFSREAAYVAAERGSREGGRGVWGSAAASKRLVALRETWAAVRLRETHTKVDDPLLGR